MGLVGVSLVLLVVAVAGYLTLLKTLCAVKHDEHDEDVGDDNGDRYLLVKSLIAVMNALYPHRTLICASANGMPYQLGDYLRSKLPDDIQIILKTADNAEELAACAPFTADYPVPESGAVYYICENGACKAPVTDLVKLNLGSH